MGIVNPHMEIDAYPLPLIEPLIERVSQNQIFSSLDLRSAHQIPLHQSERQLTVLKVLVAYMSGVSCLSG